MNDAKQTQLVPDLRIVFSFNFKFYSENIYSLYWAYQAFWSIFDEQS